MEVGNDGKGDEAEAERDVDCAVHIGVAESGAFHRLGSEMARCTEEL